MCVQSWAFSAIEQVESNWILAGNSMVELSAQQLVDCDLNNEGCNGGVTPEAFAYLKKFGLETESAYPYTCVHFL